MPKTKKQLVEDILSIEAVDTKANLMKKGNSDLESILEGLQVEKTNTTAEVPQMDMKTIMEQMKAEMMAELKEQARKEVEAEMKSNIVEVDEVPKPVVERVEIDRYRMIPVMNITSGALIYHSKRTGAEWNWQEYGDIEYMEYQELLTMRSSQRTFFDEPFLLIMDDEAVEALGLRKMYDNLVKVDSIDDIFRMRQEDFEEICEKAPRGIKLLIVSRARYKVSNGTLDSMRKVNYLNERFNTDIGQRG